MTTTLAFIGGIGWPELMLIALVVLVVFGPRRLPEIAEAFGSSIKKFRSATQDVKDEVKREIDATPKNDTGAESDRKDNSAD
jgi:sec-independent protein translocase protein TatA